MGPSISVLYLAHLCMKYSLGISNFLEEISSLSHSVVFLYFFALIAEEVFKEKKNLSLLFFGTLHSDGNIFSFLLCFSLPFFSQLFVRPPQTSILLFCISFPWGWSWSLYKGLSTPRILLFCAHGDWIEYLARESGSTSSLLHQSPLPTRSQGMYMPESCFSKFTVRMKLLGILLTSEF